MAGMQFEYDEKGGTFYYFLVSFIALVLFPSTYYLWPRKVKTDEDTKKKKECYCEPCQGKRQTLKENAPWSKVRQRATQMAILLGWVIFILVAYKASQVELDFKEFDPYSELGIDRGATNREIKKAYRSLSLIYHPDKETGNHQRFMRITKAYQALTDEEARKNWEEYGNPDGPGATHFGIALPKWIVEKQNSVWVLAAYGLVFMVILPVAVGTWWYRSIKFSAEQILMDTTQLYYYFFHKTQNMIIKRVIMVLAASMEFEKGHNHEICERPSDNEEIPPLMRSLPQLNEKNKEKPLCFPYSVKARALLHAHFERLELPPKSLELDRQYILKKCPFLLNEMVNIVAQLVALGHAGRTRLIPRLESIENVMKVSQMTIQGLWEKKSGLLQLPHITEDKLRHFTNRRRHIRSLHQFAGMNEVDRREMLKFLTDAEYMDTVNVVSRMPFIEMEVHTEVLDDDDKTITAGSIVTVTVNLKRQDMESQFEGGGLGDDNEEEQPELEELKPEENGEEDQETATPDSPQVKPKIWEKQKKKKKHEKGGKSKPKPAKPTKKNVKGATSSPSSKTEDSLLANGVVAKSKRRKRSESHDGDSQVESGSEADSEADNEDGQPKGEKDEDDWVKFQEEAKKENSLETKSKISYEVHCPHFPAVKYEWWWVYVADKKSALLVTHPVQVCSLKTEEEQVRLKFSAPAKPGHYQYSVILRSDSYIDFDQTHTIKLDVKEAKKVESHPQWDISDDEEDKDGDEGSESDFTGSETEED